jgi:glycosyltransferase involved in cell wall biosynthesis
MDALMQPELERTRVLMLCAHEPSVDPRVRWTAEFAAREFDVTVLGFNRADNASSRIEDVNGYRVVRLQRRDVNPLYYGWRMLDLVPRPLLYPAAVLGALLFPIAFVAEGLLRAAYGLVRWARSFITWRLVGWLWGRGASRLLGVGQSVDARRMRRLTTRVRYVLGQFRLQFAPAVLLFWTHIRTTAVKPDVVHCNDLDTLLVGVLAKQRFGCRLVYDAHEYFPYCDPYGRWLDTRFFALLERFLLRYVDGAVTVNPPLAALMSKAYGLKIHSVPNAEPVTDKVPAFGSPMNTLASGRVKFLFQGRFTPQRGIEELISGWQQVDGTKAALFLRGPDNIYAEQARELARSLGLLGNSVFFLDAVSEDLLVAAASEADVGIIPYVPHILNDRFACPNKLSQYLHAGVMVLANDLPYVRSVIEEAEAGIIYSSRDLSSLREAVQRIVTSPDLLRTARANGQLFARERFNWQAFAGELHALYRGRTEEGASRPNLRRVPEAFSGKSSEPSGCRASDKAARG